MSTGTLAMNEIKLLAGRCSAEKNPQSIYNKWKDNLLTMAKEREREIVSKYLRERSKLEHKRDRVLSEGNLEETDKRNRLKQNTKDLTNLTFKYHMAKREAIAVKNRIEGEMLCKYWTRNNKQAQPRDLIYVLKKPNPTAFESTYETDSTKMAELGRTYHDTLQDQCRIVTHELREEKINKVLDTIEAHTTQVQSDSLNKIIEYKELMKALKKSNNSSAPGPDGIPYKFWKSMNGQFINDARLNQRGGSQKTTCDLIKLLRLACEDIQWHGIMEDSPFLDGWMCPIYEKNEKTDIANYRPITCLNTDYKLFTKALANCLAVVITDLIHPSQAGFIPGRSLTEQTKLICMMIYYAEAKEVNGLIVALDQEKVYDKIDHEYLWRTLVKFGIPTTFINTVKSLYKGAKTQIMINGILSSPWNVTRGVRQGDPLSCLLFDLAIEPLAASLCTSTLKGYSIPGHTEKLIANLFADDTTTFLLEDDDLETLNKILNNWCIASKANFNKAKTEIIPIGSPDYQKEVLWYHYFAQPKLRRMNHGKVAECLKTNHRMVTVGDTKRIASLQEDENHLEMDECECQSCMAMNMEVTATTHTHAPTGQKI